MPTTVFFKHRSAEIILDSEPEAVRARIRDGAPLTATDGGLRIAVFTQHVCGFYETTAAAQTAALRPLTDSDVALIPQPVAPAAHTRVRLRGVTDDF